MKHQRQTARSLVAVAAGVALVLTACGGDDDATDTTPPSTTAAEATVDETDAAPATPAMQPASIAFDAQETDGTTVVVASVELPAPGFVAVHSDGGGSPGPVIGTSDLLPAGTSTDVEITLDEPVTADTTLFPMVHIDTNGNGVYEFGQVEGVDAPGATAAGDVAVVGAAVTLAGAADGSSEAGAGGAEITIVDFTFTGATEVPVGTTITVTNSDGSPHTWTAVDGSFDSEALAPGESFEFTFTEAGSFEYFCNFHPSMTGTITVVG